MTKLPEHRNPRDHIVLKPRGDLPEAPPTKLPEPRGPRGKDRLVPQPRGETPTVPPARLPEHRHSDDEVWQIRRREALTVRPPLAHLRSQLAPLPLLVSGYLLAAAGGLTLLATREGWQYAKLAQCLALAGGTGAAAVAFWIALKKPRSRHHAAFLAILGTLVIVLAALQLIPHPDAT